MSKIYSPSWEVCEVIHYLRKYLEEPNTEDLINAEYILKNLVDYSVKGQKENARREPELDF